MMSRFGGSSTKDKMRQRERERERDKERNRDRGRERDYRNSSRWDFLFFRLFDISRNSIGNHFSKFLLFPQFLFYKKKN